MSRGVTISGRDLHKFLCTLGVPIRNRGGKPPVADIDGTEIVIPGDHRKSRAGNDCITALARAFGTDRTDMIHAITGATRPNAGSYAETTKTLSTGPTTKDLISQLNDLGARLSQLRKWFSNGQHGPEMIRDGHRAVVEAGSVLDRFAASTVDAAAAAETSGLVSPDDSKHKPRSFDRLTTGAARFPVSGPSARLARKGSTETRFELVEKGEVDL